MSLKRWAPVLITLLLSILVVVVGSMIFRERRYYLISILVITLTLVMYFLQFEKRKPRTREVVLITVLCTVAVLGRVLFAPFPHVKPMVAIVILWGVAFGSQTGFTAGSISAFASNFMFGQGPWTPWQMMVLGMIGFVSGFLHNKNVPIWLLCIYGFFMTFFLYGGIMNISTGLMYGDSLSYVLTTILTGLVFDLIHAVSTMIFLAVLSKSMLRKLDRMQKKYGLLPEKVV